jgi:hypothetical protein
MGILEWNNVFMSSVLRSLDGPSLPCPVMRVVRELKTPSNFQEFLQVAQNIYLRECKLVFDNAQGFRTNQQAAQQYNSIMVQNKPQNLVLQSNLHSFGRLKDPATQGVNLMIYKIVQYMISYRMIDQCLQFLLPLAAQDPRIVTYICDCYIAVDRARDAVILLASKIKDFPYLVPLLQKQAEAFLAMELHEYAHKLATVCVELCPESFEAHIVLARC